MYMCACVRAYANLNILLTGIKGNTNIAYICEIVKSLNEKIGILRYNFLATR